MTKVNSCCQAVEKNSVKVCLTKHSVHFLCSSLFVFDRVKINTVLALGERIVGTEKPNVK